LKNLVFGCFLLALIFGQINRGFSQSEQDKLTAQEMQKTLGHQRSIMLQLDSAILLSHQGEYAAADAKFLYVLKNMRSIPSDLTYHFGLNSYYLGKYKQSVDWFNKYIQLKGTSGQYSEKTVEYLKKAEAEILKQQLAAKENAAAVLSSNDYNIDCGPSGKVQCPVCEGSTVVVKKGYFGETYKTCPFCNKKGYLDCDDYNKLIRGELKPANN
jgi:hypothetical protein